MKAPRIKIDTDMLSAQGIENIPGTGRFFLIMNRLEESLNEMENWMTKSLGLSIANSVDFIRTPLTESALTDADVLIYRELGIALLGFDDRRIEQLEHQFFRSVIPEKLIFIPNEPVTAVAPAIDTDSQSTWGVSATGVSRCALTGRGTKLAILDTGFDKKHPDFKGRTIATESFVSGESAIDRHGHGTHCTGIACGNIDSECVRYGVSFESEIFIGKVLSNSGIGAQSWILNGITWAVNQGCDVISMSLGSPANSDGSYDKAYERVGQYALSNGAVVVAAAGNESKRSDGKFSPVAAPANCPSILAVGALDSSMSVANFSNRSHYSNAKVDIAAPGVDIYSSWRMPAAYRTLSGTSMATPFVAGILSLLKERYPDISPKKLVSELLESAKPLDLPPSDIGAGLTFIHN